VVEVYSLGMRYKSYDIVFMLLYRLYRELWLGRDTVRLLDLTYGRGRFYRRVPRNRYYIVGVDIARHEWEVEPDEFYLGSSIDFVDDIISGRKTIVEPDVIVVDPPWSHEKRGRMPSGLGISSMPYHMRGISSREIIGAANRLRKHYGVPLIYRYKEPLEGSCVIVRHNIQVFRSRGTIYYGIIY